MEAQKHLFLHTTCKENPRPKLDTVRKVKKFRRFRKLLILGLLSLLIFNLLNFQNIPNWKTKAQTSSESSITLTPSADIFISPSTSNGNRRMLFVGTYTDETVCGPEGCPPVYSDSFSLINFNWNQIPSNAIILSAKLQLYHYGSNSAFNLKISKADSAWTETTNSSNSPAISGSYATSAIPNFNTGDSASIELREITIDPLLFDSTSLRQNGIALSSATNIGDPGIVFCSKDSDSFCLPQHSPKLILTFVPNNIPEKPTLTSFQNFIGGNCDASIFPTTAECEPTKSFTFNSQNLIDNDPASGAFSHSKFLLKDKFSNNLVLESPQITSNPTASWTRDLENGNYILQSESYDKKGEKNTSDSINFIYDSIPPTSPSIQDLADVTKPSANLVSINIKSNSVTDNLDSQIQYQVQYSTDSAFLTNTKTTNWQASSDFILTNSTGIEAGKNYFFRMRAKDSHENFSDWSNTSATSIEGLPKLPEINQINWKINRFRTTTFITNQKTFTFTGSAQKNHKAELFINNAKSGEAIANQNCFTKQELEYCNFAINYTYNGTSTQDANGQPLKSFSVQFRAVDENQNTSILTNRKIIYFDNIAPQKPEFNLTSDKNILDIENVTYTNGNKVTATITGEKYSDIEYKLFDSKNKLVESKLLRVQTNKQAVTSSMLKLDGKYRLELISIDGAGNKSAKTTKEFVRDSVGPNMPKYKSFKSNGLMNLEINGEVGSTIYLSNRIIGQIDKKESFIYKIPNSSGCGKKYEGHIKLSDFLGNSSDAVSYKVNTEKCVVNPNTTLYNLASGPTKGFSPYNDRKFDSSNMAEFWIEISQDKNYRITKSKIPAPQITYVNTRNNDKTADIYGLAVSSEMNMKLHITYESGRGYGFCLKFWDCSYYETEEKTEKVKDVNIILLSMKNGASLDSSKVTSAEGRWHIEQSLQSGKVNVNEKVASFLELLTVFNYKYLDKGDVEIKINSLNKSGLSNLIQIPGEKLSLMNEIVLKYKINIKDGEVGWNVKELRYLLDLLSYMPASLRDPNYITEIVRKKAEGSTRGRYLTKEKRIEIFDLAFSTPNRDYGFVDQLQYAHLIFTHEMAHSYEIKDQDTNSSNNIKPFWGISWQEIPKGVSLKNWSLKSTSITKPSSEGGDFVTFYASSKPGEDWGESVAVYFHYRRLFKNKFGVYQSKQLEDKQKLLEDLFK